MPDYSCRTYWELRLSQEIESGYEWLIPSASILPIISASVEKLTSSRCLPLNVLHFGCGSSSLGTSVQSCFGKKVNVIDTDFASLGLQANADIRGLNDCKLVPLLQLDVLSLPSILAATPTSSWDLLMDKSTADAISCGPPISILDAASHQLHEYEAIEVLCDNLAAVTSSGARWISVSYSSTRYDFLSGKRASLWRIVERVPVMLSDGRGNNPTRVVYQPETGVWAWVLERV